MLRPAHPLYVSFKSPLVANRLEQTEKKRRVRGGLEISEDRLEQELVRTVVNKILLSLLALTPQCVAVTITAYLLT